MSKSNSKPIKSQIPVPNRIVYSSNEKIVNPEPQNASKPVAHKRSLTSRIIRPAMINVHNRRQSFIPKWSNQKSIISSPELPTFPAPLPQALEKMINEASKDSSNNSQSMERDLMLASEIGKNLLEQNQQLQQKLTEIQDSKNLYKEQTLMLKDSLKDSSLQLDVKQRELSDVEAELKSQKEKYDKDTSNLKVQLKDFHLIQDDAGFFFL
ncbi:hypothetical protein HK096_007366, partial [Nowakowskiella sp. JEL0078]